MCSIKINDKYLYFKNGFGANNLFYVNKCIISFLNKLINIIVFKLLWFVLYKLTFVNLSVTSFILSSALSRVADAFKIIGNFMVLAYYNYVQYV